MKKTKLFIAALILNSAFLILNSQRAFAQTFPYGINYQAVARDANGNAEANQQVPVQFTIYQSSSSGTKVWQEQQVRTTNSMGQFTAVIGNGTPVTPFTSSSFSQINWGADSTFLKVEINSNISFTGTFSQIGNTAKFQSVPYALNANSVPYGDYAMIEDSAASGTGGGTVTAGYNTRILNHVQSSSGSSIQLLSSNQVQLAAGTYYVEASAPAFRVDYHKIRLQNITNSTTLLAGTSEISESANTTSNDQTRSFIKGFITITTANTIVEIQHYITTNSGSGNNLGVPTNEGDYEVYTQLFIKKIK
ncbi:MAG: hypothetical protein ACLQQ4_01855 [Bacteroidia bacterium]